MPSGNDNAVGGDFKEKYGVQMKSAKLELTFSMPTLEKMAVRSANAADYDCPIGKVAASRRYGMGATRVRRGGGR